MTSELCRHCRQGQTDCQIPKAIIADPVELMAHYQKQASDFPADKCPKIEEAMSSLELEGKKP